MSECASTTPRVAESLDELAVGMVVAYRKAHGWEVETVEGLWSETDWANLSPIVILNDVDCVERPTPDWLVPADTMAELEDAQKNGREGEALIYVNEAWYRRVNAAIKAVLDAATEVER